MTRAVASSVVHVTVPRGHLPTVPLTADAPKLPKQVKSEVALAQITALPVS